MQLVPSGVSLPFEYTAYDGASALFAAMKIYETTTGSAVFDSTVAMTHVGEGSYIGFFTAGAGKTYLVIKNIYTDGTFTTADPNRSPGSETIVTNDAAALSLTPADIAAVADAVWDELLAGHTTPGSAGHTLTNVDGNVTIIGDDGQFQSSIPEYIERPDTGTEDFKTFVRIYNNQGAPKDPNSNTVNVSIQDSSGTVLFGPFAMTRTAAGQYEYVFTVSPAAQLGSYYLIYDYAVGAQAYSRVDATRLVDPINLTQIENTIWDAPLASHVAAGTTGFNQNLADDIFADTDSLDTTKITTARANNLDNLDATVSSRASATALATAQTTLNTINVKLGTPAGASVSGDIAAVKSDTAGIKAKTDQLNFTGTNVNANAQVVSDKTGYALSAGSEDSVVDKVWDESQAGHISAGTFGKHLDVDVSSRESEASAATRASADITEHNTTQAAIAAVQADTDDIQVKIGTPVGTVSSDIASVKSDSTAIKVKTDQLNFTGSNVNANAQVVSDKTDYTLTSADKDEVVDRVWDEPVADHLTIGSTGAALSDAPTAVAGAVWDELAVDHTVPGSFGDYVAATRQFAADAIDELTDGGHGLQAIIDEVGAEASAVIVEVNANETKIDAIIPAIGSAKTDIISEVDQNQVLIGNLSTQLTGTQAAIIAEVNANEVKIDAVSAQVGTIQNNTTTRFIVPERLIKPDAGTKDYEFHLRLYDESGNPEAPDTTPTIRIRRLDTSTDIVVGAAMTYMGTTGAYRYTHTISAGTNEYPALVEATVVEGGVTRLVPAVTEITEFESDLNNIQAQLTAVQNDVTTIENEVTSGVHGLAAIRATETTIINEINQNETKIDQVKAQTDLIPASPATSAQVAAVNATVLTRPDIAAIQARLDLLRDNLKGVDGRDLTQVYDHFDISGVAMTADPRFAHLDADISSRSTLTAAQVWAYATRTLTANLLLSTADLDAIWGYLVSQATVPNSIGKRIADFLDATISSRATAAQVTAALAGVAQETTVLAVQGTVVTEANQNEVKLNTLLSDTATIKGKTNNLPSDPASNSTVTGGDAVTQAAVAAVDLKVTGIKAKTDNLPASPASAGAVAAIPTNPLLTNDARLTGLVHTGDLVPIAKTADLALLATAAGLTAAKTAIIAEVNQNEVKLDTAIADVLLVKAKTDTIPSNPVTDPDLAAATQQVLDAIDAIPSGSGGASAADIWSYATRELTTDPTTFGPDISNLATHADVAAQTYYENQMTTSFDGISGDQEVLAWAEKSGQQVVGSDCTVEVRNGAGGLAWTDTIATPNSDGVFRFTYPVVLQANKDYYVVITIKVDAVFRTNQRPFTTVG